MYAFIHIPKTAGTSLVHLLRRAFGTRHCDIRAPLTKRRGHQWVDAHDLRRALRLYPLPAGIAGHNVCCFNGLEAVGEELQYFTFLRAPEDRFISQFCHLHRHLRRELTAADLDTHLQKARLHNVQTRWLCGSENPEAALEALRHRIGFVGLTERFDESLLLWRRWLGRPELGMAYATKNRRHKSAPPGLFAESGVRERIAAVNQADQLVYDYVRDRLFPRQVAAYGPTLSNDLAALRQANANYREPQEPLPSRVRRNLVYKPLLHLHCV